MNSDTNLPVARLQDAGQRLKAAGYDEESMAAAMGVSRLGRMAATDMPLYVRRLADRGPLGTLIRVFHLGQRAPRAHLDAILDAPNVDALAACHLADIQDGRVVPRIQLTPFDGLIFAHDPETGVPAQEHVQGISPSTRMLYHLTLRAPVARALDIGTGCGVQALALARHAAHVVGTDVNPRALWLARCNAALNGITNVEWREGSLLEPIARERFDLVVANPPFVISPDAAYAFRDAGPATDVSQEPVSSVHQVLQPGGCAQTLHVRLQRQPSHFGGEQASVLLWPGRTARRRIADMAASISGCR